MHSFTSITMAAPAEMTSRNISGKYMMVGTSAKSQPIASDVSMHLE